MNITSSSLSVDGLDVDVVYKDIKNLNISVYPPLGRVRVSAPFRLNDEHVRLAVVSRLPWIKRWRARFCSAAPQSEREMVTGESHFLWGVRHHLEVLERPGRARCEVDGEQLLLYTSTDSTAAKRRELLDRWYREQLRQRIPDVIAKWEPIVGVPVPLWSIRRMKTRWGSYNPSNGRICFNLELAKKHPDCLEYVVVHEMTHYFERNHGAGFVTLMDRFMPSWRSRRDLLNDSLAASK